MLNVKRLGVLALLCLFAPAALAQGADEPIFGHQLMTQQERLEYRERMRSAETAEERDRIRAEHHERVLERAREQGVTLPDLPPERGMMGQGQGQGRRQGR